MWTLKLCIGLFLGICGQYQEMDFLDQKTCEYAKSQMNPAIGDGYAICVPLGTKTKRG